MIGLYIYLFLCTVVIPFVNAEARKFRNPQMCIREKRLKNCSFQVSSPHPNSCLIYNTDACKNNEFRPWILEPLHKPKLESDTDFTASIEPYPFITDSIQTYDPVSAINISLTSFSRNISGFSIIMNRDSPPKNVCRIIDFWNSKDDIKIPFHFFYDCFNNLRESHWRNVLITFRAYPVNIELTYQVYIPRVSEKNSGSSCTWTPLVMVYCEGLTRNHIQLKFTNPRNDSNVLFFVVTLLDSSDVEIDKTRIPSNIKNDMIFSEFQPVKNGYYTVSVSIILPQESCLVFKSDLFFVGSEVKDNTLVIFIILVIIMVVSASVLIYYLCRRYLTSVTSVLKPSILLVYFHKQLQHEFLVMWAEYLEKHHGVNAYTLYKCGGNPKKWLDDVTSKSNIIVFVISEGLAEVFDEKNSSYEEDTYWVEQLPEAKALISSLKTGEKVFCKVCFPFSKKEHVPKCLKNPNKGPLFRLLGKVDQTEEFLCYIFNCSAKFRFLNRLCCIKHHVIKKTDSMQKDVKDLKDKLKKVNENKHVIVSGTNANEEILQNASINEQSDLISQIDYKIIETSLTIIDENADTLAANSSFNQENSLSQSSLSTEDSGKENDQFHQQGENVSYLAKEQKKEFLLYCLGKSINFQS